MEFVCPVCEAAGNIPQENIEHPLTKTTCQNCKAILLINPDSGRVDAHKSSLKDFPAVQTSDSRSTDKTESVLSMRPQSKDSRDWTAVVLVAIILIILISAGVYFVVNLDIV